MQKMKFVQAIVALAVVAGGAMFAREGLATSCGASNQTWGNHYGVCSGFADVQAGDRGLSTAYIAVNCLNPAGVQTCYYAGLVGVDANGNAISGCKAEDFTDDGNSVSDTSGCQNGRTLSWVVDFDWE